jgi:hypothetical protein
VLFSFALLLCSIMFVIPVFQKINAKNAFSLQLIDYMAMMLKKQDSKMDNFQVKYISCYSVHSLLIYNNSKAINVRVVLVCL